jgi:hypothetical protein
MLTTDQWQQRVQDARRRLEEFVAKHLRRRRILCSPKKRKLKLPTDRRALRRPEPSKR